MRSPMATMQRLFDRHGSGYDRLTRGTFRRVHARALADATDTAPAGGVVLDVGAGPGRLAIALARQRPDLTVHAIDISPSMVELAGWRVAEAGLAGRVHVQRADVAALPLPDADVDLVVSTMSFHHWPDVPGAVRELRRVVRPGGRIQVYDARIAPWRQLSAAAGQAVPRTPVGLFFARADVPSAGDER